MRSIQEFVDIFQKVPYSACQYASCIIYLIPKGTVLISIVNVHCFWILYFILSGMIYFDSSMGMFKMYIVNLCVCMCVNNWESIGEIQLIIKLRKFNIEKNTLNYSSVYI